MKSDKKKLNSNTGYLSTGSKRFFIVSKEPFRVEITEVFLVFTKTYGFRQFLGGDSTLKGFIL